MLIFFFSSCPLSFIGMNDESVVFHIIVIQTEIMIKASKGRKRWTMFNRALALENVQ